MNKLTEEQIKQILWVATTNKILILTVNDNMAYDLKSDIVSYLKSNGFGTALSTVQKRGYIYFNGAVEHIMVMSLSWYKRIAKFDFNGLVLITNRSIIDVPYILQQPILLTEFFMNERK